MSRALERVAVSAPLHTSATIPALDAECMLCWHASGFQVKSKKPGAPAPAPAAAPAPAKPKAKAAPKRKAIDESEDDAEEGVPDPAVPAPTKQKVKASPKRKVKEESPDDE